MPKRVAPAFEADFPIYEGIVETYGGGTALGAVQVAPAKHLDALHGIPAAVAGSSVGCLTAIMRSQGMLGDLEAEWLAIKGSRSFQSFRLDVWKGLFSFKPLRRILERNLEMSRLQCDVHVGMVDLGNKRYETVLLNDLTKKEAIDAILASCTQYGIHRDALFQGRLKCDSGARHVLVPILGDETWAMATSPISNVWKDNVLKQDEIGITRGLELLIDHVEENDFEFFAQNGAWLVEPLQRPGNSFDASPKTIRHRLYSVGEEAWQHRRKLEPLRVC